MDNSMKKGQIDFLSSEAKSNARTIDFNLQKIQSSTRIGLHNSLLNQDRIYPVVPDENQQGQNPPMSLEQYKI